MAPAAAGERSLKETPTWAVAIACAVFILISIIIEQAIHALGKWFQKRNKKAMLEALEKIKAELMLLGFISLLLTVGTRYLPKICIPEKYGNTMLPCELESKYKDDGGGKDDGKNKGGGEGDGDENDRRRKLLEFAETMIWRRVLAAPSGGDSSACSEGKVPLISPSGMHQLHIFIFVLAVFHVLYSVLTMALAQAKMKKWKAWESETSSLEYQFTNDPSRFRFTRQTSFVKRHSGFSTMPGIRWIVAFFRQFIGSVTKVDYLTMRHGFINAHFAPNSKFDFHKYIKRSMEDDFKIVVGISIPLWIFAAVFLVLNVHKWHAFTWLSLAPLIILLLVGTKLELILMEMAQEMHDRTTVVKGAPVVEPSNKFFWFNRPEWILLLIHFTLFQNAFQMAYFLWTSSEFGFTSCFHENLPLILTRVFLGVALQILCSYITFPLYALITQMGSHMKKAIFEEQTAKALKNWQKAAKQRKKLRKAGDASSSGFVSGENTPSQGSSPLHLLHNQKHRSNQDLESVLNSPRSVSYQSDTDLSEMEGSAHDGNGIRRSEDQPAALRKEGSHSIDFSFVKP
ncbi:MLO protein homolog 1-like [Prunus avium]|uniref:MLO-like protein n=1 Tax=Prunus avium TaxID=42229 RepID=A0A6P5TJA8_PRUAV|nr:MLO protein homolog 1-like [Prunus avium]